MQKGRARIMALMWTNDLKCLGATPSGRSNASIVQYKRNAIVYAGPFAIASPPECGTQVRWTDLQRAFQRDFYGGYGSTRMASAAATCAWNICAVVSICVVVVCFLSLRSLTRFLFRAPYLCRDMDIRLSSYAYIARRRLMHPRLAWLLCAVLNRLIS